MSLTDPSIVQLLSKVDCRYTLVVEVSKRARQLVDGEHPLVDARDRETMPVSVAVDEVSRGLIGYSRPIEFDLK
ncbi:MAG: DNA-directed RNA polymerase subunit omega [Clostridia bacterium]|nr:DNA-directed RNA polymerase subunit omega [Clostridia bacterium]